VTYPGDDERVLARAWARAVVASSAETDLAGPPLDGAPGEMPGLMDALAIDTEVPVDSSSRVKSAGKRALRGAQRWYVRYLAEQVEHMGRTIGGALVGLDARLRRVEEQAGVQHAMLRAEVLASSAPALDPAVPAICLSALAGASGRVVHAEAGGGDLVLALQAAGIDAYGVDPGLGVEPGRSDLEIWRVDVLEHLRSLEPRSLGGAVLSGIVDRLPPGELVALVDVVWAALEETAAMVVVTTDPRWWLRLGSVRADLAPGRPLNPETWVHLFVERGATDVTAHAISSAGSVAESVDTAADPRLSLLVAELFPPSHHVVVARRVPESGLDS